MTALRLSCLFVLLLASAGCAPCDYDAAIVRGEVTDAAGLAVEGGTVEIIPSTGDTIEVSVFGAGFYEASVASGTYEVVAYDEAGDCFSELIPTVVEPCDEAVVNLTIVGCF